MNPDLEYDTLMTAAEVALALGVDSRTVGRWAREGRITWITTPGGRRRYRRADVKAQIAASESPQKTP